MKASLGQRWRGIATATTAIKAAEFHNILFLLWALSKSASTALQGSDHILHHHHQQQKQQQQRPGCAVLYSGHVRSFVQPRVYTSHQKYLIRQLELDCDVDVFMYLSVEDVVPSRQGRGDLADKLSFTAYSPQKDEVDLVVKLFNPVAIEFHQDQAGYIPNRCEHRCEYNAYWQLYKIKAVFRMMEKHEALAEQRYTWVVRSRLDIAWMLPMPPVSRFPPIRVTAGHNFFPLADQLLLVPRQFAPAVFGAVSLCYTCSVLKKQVETGVPAQTESLLRLAMRQAGVPFGFYEFPIVIVRNNEGGVCSVLHPLNLVCQLLVSGLLIDPAVVKCSDVMNRWHRNACREMFPPIIENDADIEITSVISKATTNGLNVPGAANLTHVEDDRTYYVWEGNHSTEAMVGVSATRSPGESMSEIAPAATDSAIGDSENKTLTPVVVSFEEATRRQEGILEDIRRLREAIRVRAMPIQDPSNFFIAHHYPFHQTNGASLDAISTIACFRLSQEDLNRIAIAFACSLSDVETGDIFKGESEIIEELEPMSAKNAFDSDYRNPERDPLPLVVRKDDNEDGPRAKANCMLVEPLHDIWMKVLLRNEFEPSEPVCRGPVMPCFQKAVLESYSIAPHSQYTGYNLGSTTGTSS